MEFAGDYLGRVTIVRRVIFSSLFPVPIFYILGDKAYKLCLFPNRAVGSNRHGAPSFVPHVVFSRGPTSGVRYARAKVHLGDAVIAVVLGE